MLPMYGVIPRLGTPSCIDGGGRIPFFNEEGCTTIAAGFTLNKFRAVVTDTISNRQERTFFMVVRSSLTVTYGNMGNTISASSYRVILRAC